MLKTQGRMATSVLFIHIEQRKASDLNPKTVWSHYIWKQAEHTTAFYKFSNET